MGENGTDTAFSAGGSSDEIDQVLSHSRHEDRISDKEDIPQENLVCDPYIRQIIIDFIAEVPCQVERVLAYP